MTDQLQPDPGDAFLRLARIYRHRGGAWHDFWQDHRAAILVAFPFGRDRAELVNRLMEIVIFGGSGEPCEEIE